MSDYVGLHTHSHFSLLDGLNTPEEIAATVKELGQDAISITDHGTLSGHRDFQKACAEHDVKPILGLEAYISPTDRFDKRTLSDRTDSTQIYNHIILQAKNQAGVENLHHMSREAWESGYYYKPRIDWELLDEYGDGIIVLSGCLSGLIAKAWETGNPDAAERWTKRLAERFGEDFYIEVQPHNPIDLNNYLLDTADKYGVGAVVTTDSHYSRPEDRVYQEAMLVLATGSADKSKNYSNTKDIKSKLRRINTLYPPEKRLSLAEFDLFIMTIDEVRDRMVERGIERTDIYENTVEVAEKVGEYEFHQGLDFLPKTTDNPADTLRERVQVALEEKGLSSDTDYVERLEEELRIIQEKNFSPYFIIVEDMVRWAKNQDILVGPGRGSAGGSLVCYLLGITDVDPLEHGLLFFRFIDESREDYPDIDVDFADRDRYKVKAYLREKYGHAASISNFIYFSEKGVVRDAARVFRVPISEVNKALKKIDTFKQYQNSTLEEVLEFRKKYPEVEWLANKLRGRIRSVGMHAGGVVVSSKPIEDFAPIETRDEPNEKVKDRVPVVAWDMERCADIGLIKLDVLGLSHLTVIDDALDLIEERHGKRFKLWGELAPFDDPKVYEELSKGNTTGVFQADTSPYRNLLKKMGTDSFADLVASNALIRPGAMNTVGEEFIARKHGEKNVHFPHHLTESFLNDTYGEVIYQEQVMLTATELGGMSGTEANKLRKIIGKKRDASEFDEFKSEFMKGATQHIGLDEAERLWTSFEAHADYSFNKSHAVSYSVVSYWTMWLKLYYPLEYIASLLMNEGDKDKVTEYLIEAKRLGIDVLLPHINKSQAHLTIEGDKFRLGLTDIKYIGKRTYENIKEHAPYQSYSEFAEVANKKYSGINSQAMEALNYVGAAAFNDNPRRGDESDYFYDYLNIPKFDNYDFPERVYDLLTDISEFDSEGTFVLKAMVKQIKKRGKGWSLIELLDETGTCGVFHDEDTDIVPGQQYFILVSWNRIMRFVEAGEVYEAVTQGSDDPFVRYLLTTELKVGDTEKYVVAAHKRTTKAGKKMATLVLSDSDKDIKRVLVFPRTFPKVYNLIGSGEVIKPNLFSLDDGALALNDLRR